MLRKKFWQINFEKQNLNKNVEKKKCGKINYKTKIFIIKIYSNIDKCHTIFASLALFDKNRTKDRE